MRLASSLDSCRSNEQKQLHQQCIIQRHKVAQQQIPALITTITLNSFSTENVPDLITLLHLSLSLSRL